MPPTLRLESVSGRVQLIHTGGTLGMERGPGGHFRPRSGHLRELLDRLPELQDPRVPSFDLIEFDELLDSANMTPRHWSRIAERIAATAADYDGTVVVHGTDTLAYTASALSFVLEGLQAPVVLTGSQIPLCEPRTDARENLIAALCIAASAPLPEVCLYFNGRLLRGNRATKTDATGFIAFESPAASPLGRVGVDIELQPRRFRPASPGPVSVQPLSDAQVAAYRFFPGVRPASLAALLAEPTQGLVLECYGSGNGPVRDPELLAVLRAACDRGVVVVAVTQCLRGSVELQRYETGAELASAGVVSGYDLTAEAALTKLLYLLSKPELSRADVRRLMGEDLRGELTRPAREA